MSVDIAFISHNRLAFTIESFQALVAFTDWDRVDNLYICDDNSTDGTAEWLQKQATFVFQPVHVQFVGKTFGGPVAALNHVLDITQADYIAKVDNDLIVCMDWLTELYRVLEREPRYDAVGVEPGFAGRVQPVGVKRYIRGARWIGGQGLFRTRCFQRRRPSPSDRWFGLTEFWRRHAVTGWIDPDLPCFNLDHLTAEPWRSFAEEYVRQGWSRRWEPYDLDMERDYAGWWLNSRTDLTAARC